MSVRFLVIYTLTVFIASIAPGPSMLLALNHGTKYGVKRAVGTACGNVAATLLQALFSIIGLSAVLIHSVALFLGIKYLGAGYLAYLGIRMLFLRDDGIDVTLMGATSEKKSKDLFFEAFGVTIGNPKAIVFFTALFPQFVHPGNDTLLQSGWMILILLATTFACMMTYSLFGQYVTGLLNHARNRKLFNSGIGIVFIIIGIGLAVQN